MQYALLAFAILACANAHQSALNPAGPQAERISKLWYFMLVISTVAYVAVIVALVYAAAHRRRHRAELDDAGDARVVGDHAAARGAREDREAEAARTRTMSLAVALATAATVVILFVFLLYNFSVGRAIAAPPSTKPLVVSVTGYQWWWQVEYEDTLASNRVTTANEIHVPVGRPIVIKTTSRDVIHSFWAPNLHGKKDLIPGYTTVTSFQADTPGVYRGQCAEFCGHQHAKMAFYIIAESPKDFAEWAALERQPAPPPSDSVTRRGQQVFMSNSCAMCHNITGTGASATVGPDLTHLASRRSIAAGSLPNTRGNLGGWIVDPQSIKPGTHMPSNQIEPSDLQALLTYLQSLK